MWPAKAPEAEGGGGLGDLAKGWQIQKVNPDLVFLAPVLSLLALGGDHFIVAKGI